MSALDYSALAARVLKRKPTAPRESGLSRDRGIAIIAQAMRESNRARRRLRWWVAGAVTTAAAVAAAAVLTMPRYLRHSHEGSAAHHVATACGNSPACAAAAAMTSNAGIDIGHMDGRDVEPGGVMQADLGRPARVDFDSGTRMALDGNTMLAYDEGAANHRFSLSRGSVHLEVKKLKKGQRFLLNTLDAEVEVRGTIFDVAVLDASNGCEQRTRVSVKEGLVEVRTANELHSVRAGDVWTAECSAVSRAAATPSSNNSPNNAKLNVKAVVALDSLAKKVSLAPIETQSDMRGSTAGDQAPVQSDAQPASDLAKQNDMYARASVERNQGHIAEALALYNQLVARYPSSALVESAAVQRIRILRQSDRAEAIREANRYLLQFPKGFARVEAEALVNSP